jgi:murein DD-endopeptidase MepM/ murein hydrolase activator NlpD
MKKNKQREILLVPPSSAKVRILRLPLRLVVFFLLVIACGFAGYFIPFNSFTIDVVEQNQRINLESQNKKLLAAIRPMHRLLDNLNDQIEDLETKKKGITEKIGQNKPVKAAQQKKSKPSLSDLNKLIVKAQRTEAFFYSFSEAASQRSAIFDSVPVIRPITDSATMGALFDHQRDPFTGLVKDHFGIDFIARTGTPIIAPASGVVTRVEDGRIWGKRITITHAFGFSTVFAHCGTLEAFTGKRVKKGDCIARIGVSGVSSGPHLHYEIWYKGRPVNPQDLFFPQVDTTAYVASR